MFLLWNDTDQVFASPKRFKSVIEAEAYARKFRERFMTQGYYLTADGYRISPDDICLKVLPTNP